MINTHYLELPLSRTYFHGSKGARATEVRLYKADCHLNLPLMCWAPLYSSYLQECDKGCEVLCIYNWLKNPCSWQQSIISVNVKAEGEPEKGVACLKHIFRQFVFNTYSLPSKGGKDGVYYTILKKSKLLLVNFHMISAKETSSGTKYLI